MMPPVEEAAHDASLTELLPELLLKIAEHLAADEDVLRPRHLGSLARTCRMINEAVRDAKDQLRVEYTAARALLVKCRTTVEQLVAERPTKLHWYDKGLVDANVRVLRNVLKSEAMARVETLNLAYNSLGEGRHCHRGCGCGRRYAAAQVAGAPQE